MGYNGFITYPSFNHSALEACPKMNRKIIKYYRLFKPFWGKRDFFATSVLSESEDLQVRLWGVGSISAKTFKSCKNQK